MEGKEVSGKIWGQISDDSPQAIGTECSMTHPWPGRDGQTEATGTKVIIPPAGKQTSLLQQEEKRASPPPSHTLKMKGGGGD